MTPSQKRRAQRRKPLQRKRPYSILKFTHANPTTTAKHVAERTDEINIHVVKR